MASQATSTAFRANMKKALAGIRRINLEGLRRRVFDAKGQDLHIPHRFGDYVIEYGEDDTGDEFEDFPGDEGNWWTSCILYQVFDNFRNSRNRRRSRVADTRKGNRRSSYDTSNSDEGSVSL